MITFLMILAGILLFGFLILIHEFGHFFVARKCGVQVNEFSIGMGPRLFHWHRGETEYSIRAFPIGGFCEMEGEEERSENPRAFLNKPCWKRLLILVAGAGMNFLAGFLLILILNLQVAGFATNQIDAFYEGFPSSADVIENGLMENDELLAIDGSPVYIQNDIPLLLNRGSDTNYDLRVLRDGEVLELKEVPLNKREYDINGQKVMLYGLQFRMEKKSFESVLKYTWLTSVDYVRTVWMSLGDLIGGRAGINDLMGPVGVVDTMNTMAQQSSSAWEAILYILNFGGLIAVNLAVVNLLPLPALDGGRILFTLVEMIFRKPVPQKYEAWIHTAGFILLMILAIIVFSNDIIRILTR